MEEENQDRFIEKEEDFKRPVEQDNIPVTNQEQLGQVILQTIARTSDANEIVFKRVRKPFPIIEKAIVTDQDGQEVEIEKIVGWEEKTWEIPIEIQPKYREMITDDIAKAFLTFDDLVIYRDYVMYCKMVKSFSDRYGEDLSPHHNNMRDEAMALVVSSGALDGQRVQLAKSSIIKTDSKETLSRFLQDGPQKKKKSFFGLPI